MKSRSVIKKLQEIELYVINQKAKNMITGLIWDLEHNEDIFGLEDNVGDIKK